jgi:general stress protein 26
MAKDKDNDKAGKPKDPIKKLRKLIKGIPVAMLTTSAADGSLRSRPMATQEDAYDGDLWFLTRYHSPKSEEIQDNQKVNVSYASPKNERFVSISGTATLAQDPAKVKELWRGKYKAWFPEGKKDPELALLKIRVDRAEYWDRSESRMVDLPRFAPTAAAPGVAAPGRFSDRVEDPPAPGGAQG